MVNKYEYADPVYYCRIKKELQNEGLESYKLACANIAGELSLDNTECNFSPHPDCRRCDVEKENNWIFERSKR